MKIRMNIYFSFLLLLLASVTQTFEYDLTEDTHSVHLFYNCYIKLNERPEKNPSIQPESVFCWPEAFIIL